MVASSQAADFSRSARNKQRAGGSIKNDFRKNKNGRAKTTIFDGGSDNLWCDARLESGRDDWYPTKTTGAISV